MPADGTKKSDDSAAEVSDKLHKTDKKDTVEELVTKFKQSSYSQRYRLASQLSSHNNFIIFITYYNVFNKLIFLLNFTERIIYNFKQRQNLKY